MPSVSIFVFSTFSARLYSAKFNNKFNEYQAGSMPLLLEEELSDPFRWQYWKGAAVLKKVEPKEY